jgi:hypothetical protein
LGSIIVQNASDELVFRDGFQEPDNQSLHRDITDAGAGAEILFAG